MPNRDICCESAIHIYSSTLCLHLTDDEMSNLFLGFDKHEYPEDLFQIVSTSSAKKKNTTKLVSDLFSFICMIKMVFLAHNITWFVIERNDV